MSKYEADLVGEKGSKESGESHKPAAGVSAGTSTASGAAANFKGLLAVHVAIAKHAI